MARRTVAERLEEYNRRHRELAGQIAEIGTVVRRERDAPLHPLHVDGMPVQRRPAAPHGPYWQWSAKVNGKTVTKRLTATEARLYTEWIGNDRRVRALLAQMRTVDAKAAELLLKEAVNG